MLELCIIASSLPSRQSFRLGLGRPVLAKSPAGVGPKAPLLQPKPQTRVFRIGIIFL